MAQAAPVDVHACRQTIADAAALPGRWQQTASLTGRWQQTAQAAHADVRTCRRTTGDVGACRQRPAGLQPCLRSLAAGVFTGLSGTFSGMRTASKATAMDDGSRMPTGDNGHGRPDRGPRVGFSLFHARHHLFCAAAGLGTAHPCLSGTRPMGVRKRGASTLSPCGGWSPSRFGEKKEDGRGRDKLKRQTTKSQLIVATRPLCRLQYPVAYLSRLQRILPATRWELYFKAASDGLANDTCPWGHLLRVGKRAAGVRFASSSDSDLEAFSHNSAYGRADIEGSKSNVAMNTWLPQASYPCGNFSDTSSSKSRRSKGTFGYALMVRIRTRNQNQTSFYPSVLHEISILVELMLGHLRYLLIDVPPQQNSYLKMSSAWIGHQSVPWVQKEGQCPAFDSLKN
ncbi:UNVERIFIED_CONTAM: hypothetical protein Sindi_2660500 [Sesamum indicum]